MAGAWVSLILGAAKRGLQRRGRGSCYPAGEQGNQGRKVKCGKRRKIKTEKS